MALQLAEWLIANSEKSKIEDFTGLAKMFTHEYFSEPHRGYGQAVTQVFKKLKVGAKTTWPYLQKPRDLEKRSMSSSCHSCFCHVASSCHSCYRHVVLSCHSCLHLDAFRIRNAKTLLVRRRLSSTVPAPTETERP